jgi:hypothetical protein
MAESRRAIAEKLVDLHFKHADLFRDIDNLKEKLRQFAEASDEDVVDLRAEVRRLIKDDGLGVDDLKAELRKLGKPGHEGFTEEFDGKGFVQVSGGSEAKFKGIMPTLDQAKFLDMPQSRQAALIEAGVVVMVKEFTKGSKPSVTVKL